jgi:hypothetical protein
MDFRVPPDHHFPPHWALRKGLCLVTVKTRRRERNADQKEGGTSPVVGIASDMAAIIRRVGISHFRILELYAWEGERPGCLVGCTEGGWERGERKGGKMGTRELLERGREREREKGRKGEREKGEDWRRERLTFGGRDREGGMDEEGKGERDAEERGME